MTMRATILVVDDDKSSLEMLRDMIEEFAGHRAHIAQSAEAAIELFESLRGRVDLLITDVTVPEMSGPELFRQLRSSQPELSCIFVSGFTEHRLRQEFHLPDDTTFLRKPFRLDELTTLVFELLSSRSAET